MMLNNAADHTHAFRWARLWDRLESVGIPVDSSRAIDWQRRYDSVQASTLLATLDELHAARLPLAVISHIGEAIVTAFKMGQEFDGRIN